MGKKELTLTDFIREPAFPSLLFVRGDYTNEVSVDMVTEKYNPGLTKLEYFTALAMQGVLVDRTLTDTRIAELASSAAFETLKTLYADYLVLMEK